MKHLVGHSAHIHINIYDSITTTDETEEKIKAREHALRKKHTRKNKEDIIREKERKIKRKD